LRAAIPAPPTFRSPGLHLELLRDPPGRRAYTFIYLFPLPVLAYIPLQRYLDFNAAYILIDFKAPRCTRSTQFLSKLGLGCVHAHRVPSPLDIRLSFFGHEIPYSYASVSSVRLDILKNKDLSLSVVGIQVVLSSFPSTYPPRFQLCHHIALQPLLLLPVYSLLGIPSHQGAGDVEHYARRTRGGSCHTNLI